MLSRNWKSNALNWMQLQICHQFSTVKMKRLMVVVVVGGGGGGWAQKQSHFNPTGGSKKTAVLKILCLTLQFTRPYACMCMVLVSVTLVTQNLRGDLPLWSE